MLNSSERSLRRHLSDRGTNYRQLVSEFRCDLAKQYLSTTRLSLAEISDLVGFADTKSFMRAFKRWTGETLVEFRNRSL